jgi:3-hydroxymyristoyl/3-hydroxydecanoyl-(acyl carrier protein) dehydratase
MPRPEPAYEILGSAPVGNGWHLSVRIPESSPLFAGHFPGHPILPGVAHLALVTRALSDWQGREVALTRVRGWKLRQPVQPGETLEIRLTRRGEGEVDFVLERAGEAVSRGLAEIVETAWR